MQKYLVLLCQESLVPIIIPLVIKMFLNLFLKLILDGISIIEVFQHSEEL
jgi:hypothetical protein